MKKAIQLNKNEYKLLQNNLKATVTEIYKKSIQNIKKVINQV